MTDLRPESAVRLPVCTSETITLSNLDLQLSNLRHWYAQTRRVDAGIQLVHGLLSRYSVSARDADLQDVEALTYALVEQAPEDPRTWMALAEVSAMRHRLADAGQALLTATANGAPPVEIAEIRADLLEAVGEHRAALEIRIAHSGGLPPAQRLSRIACCQLALGAHHDAVATFTSAIRTYADASPLPLGSMLFNWGHTWEHIGDRGRAALAYRAVIRYLPSHVRAHSALAECSMASGDPHYRRIVGATRHQANPDDPISLGQPGLSSTVDPPRASPICSARRSPLGDQKNV